MVTREGLVRPPFSAAYADLLVNVLSVNANGAAPLQRSAPAHEVEVDTANFIYYPKVA